MSPNCVWDSKYNPVWCSRNPLTLWTSGNYHLRVRHREQGVESFRHERVREDSVRHVGVSEVAEHGDLDHGHDLAPFTAQDRAAQDLPAIRVEDGLHEAARLPGLDGPDNS